MVGHPRLELRTFSLKGRGIGFWLINAAKKVDITQNSNLNLFLKKTRIHYLK